MKRNIFLVFVWFIFNPIYGQINFDERVDLYDIDSLSINTIYDDFDNDNDIDIIKYMPYNQRNVVLQKNENGDLNLKLPIYISNNVNPIISLDINNDSYPDLITYHSFTTIGVLYNLQNDTFSEEETLIDFSGSYSISPIKFDYNSDGFIDLIVKSSQGNAYVLLNDQNGGFLAPQFLIALDVDFDSIYKIVDFDNDGDFDLYVSDYNLKIYLNNNGTFVTSNLLGMESNSFEEYGILDLDGNGYQDILYWKNGAIWAKYYGINPDTDQLIILDNLPVVENIPFSYFSNNDHSIFIKNVDTGIYDVYIALETAPEQSNIYKFNINNGLFSSAEVVLSNFDVNIFYLSDFKFHDLNNNGAIDFSFSSNFNSQNMLLVNYDIDNLSDKTICIQQTINTDGFTVVDMNGDGIEDVCVGHQNGLGYFDKMVNNEPSPVKHLLGVMSNPNASNFSLNNIVDFDNDGLGDVIDYSDSGMYAKVYKNLGNDNFEYIQNVSIPILTTGIFFVDIDNDGYEDLLFKKNYYSTDDDELIWARNNNGINFENIQPLLINYSNDINTDSIAFDDFNNDGSTDMVIKSNYLANDTFYFEIILLENQNGVFSGTSIATLAGYYAEGKIKIKDIDQDGDLDIFVYGMSGNPFLLYKNDGQNNFQKITIGNILIYDIAFDDNDGDGKYEIYALNYTSNLYLSKIVYYKTLNFVNFSKFDIDSFVSESESNASILLFDYNNDTKKDLFVTNSNFLKELISVYINTSNTLAIEETTHNNNLKIFPNPFMNSINWNGEDNKNYNLQLFTINGVLIHQEKTSSNRMDLSFLNSGIYLLVIEDDLHSKSTYKIIKK